MAKPTIYTVGHSDHPIDEFIAMLKKNGVTRVVDVRKLTGSDAEPQFNEDRLGPSLAHAGIQYGMAPALSGRRPKQKGVDPAINAWWDNQSFHNYADYAMSRAFAQGLAQLERGAVQHVECIMCAEAVWWRCHRRIIADHLIASGYPVKNIMADGAARPATLSLGARVRDGRVTYPESADGTHSGAAPQPRDRNG